MAIIPLLNRIYGSVPSKIFEYAKLGLPMIYFGGGEGEDMVVKHKLGWIAKAGDYENLNQVLSGIKKSDLQLKRKVLIQKTAIEYFDFNKQLNALVKIL